MAKENRFSPIPQLPDKSELEKLISNLQYRKLEVSQLPEPIRSNPLISKFNSVIMAASGSSETMLYSFNGIRIDKGYVDEHPFVLHYDSSNSGNNFGGIIHHGNWQDRTVKLEKRQEDAISASGLTAQFEYKGIPPGASGSLYDLKNNGMLEGVSKQFDILHKNKSNKA
jgi:hypothetical protein